MTTSAKTSELYQLQVAGPPASESHCATARKGRYSSRLKNQVGLDNVLEPKGRAARFTDAQTRSSLVVSMPKTELASDSDHHLSCTEPYLQERYVKNELDNILSSVGFMKSPRMSRLLAYLVQRLRDGTGSAKEYTIGIEVFDKDSSFDPRVDPIVRVEASRLRKCLWKYYSTEGGASSIRISLPKGRYLPDVTSIASEPSLHHTVKVQDRQITLAVLPFTVVNSTDSSPESGEIIASRLIYLLSQEEHLNMIPKPTSESAPSALNARQLGEYLGTGLLIEGTAFFGKKKKVQLLSCLVDCAAGFNVCSFIGDATTRPIENAVRQLANSILNSLNDTNS